MGKKDPCSYKTQNLQGLTSALNVHCTNLPEELIHNFQFHSFFQRWYQIRAMILEMKNELLEERITMLLY